MSSKRDLDEHGCPEPEPKRAKKHRTRHHQNSDIDPTWGQKYVFSDLDDATTIPAGEEDDFEDDADAMAYLSSVRQQASLIPHLLVAPKVQIGPQMPAGLRKGSDSDSDSDLDEEGEVDEGASRYPSEVCDADSRGYYEDGAYIGVRAEWDNDDPHEDDHDDSTKTLRAAYFSSVRNRYRRLRDRLHARVPPDFASRLAAADRPTDVPPFGRHSPTAKIWSRLIHDTDPHPLQVALMSKDSVLRILRVILGGRLLRQGSRVPERTSRWLWALLARLPDEGELNHAEIGCIRDLGRRAILLGTDLVEALEDDEEYEFAADFADDGYDSTPRGEETKSDGEHDALGPEPDEAEAENNLDSAADDVAMDLASSDTEAEAAEGETDLEEAKRVLLAKLAQAQTQTESEGLAQEQVQEEKEREQRARMNMRATLSMVITVAGEFYGQRDLLEFREPFAMHTP